MPRQIMVQGHRAWCKVYQTPSRSRRIVTRAWNQLTNQLDVSPLRSPPAAQGEEAAKQLELRRIRELQAQGVLVPEVLGEGANMLLLGDMGPSLSSRLKQSNGTDETDSMVHRTIAAIADAHRRGAYLGQAFARNITITDEHIGFIDFEEDPLQVMTLPEAQARDWLLFSAGVARYYDGRVSALSRLLGEGLPQAANDVADEIHRTTGRLGFVQRCTRHLGHRARAIGAAITSLDASMKVMLLVAILSLDFVSDGDSDILRILSSLM